MQNQEALEVQQEGSLKLDYTIESPEQRNELVKKIVASMPPEKLTNRYLEILADYIVFAMTKEQKKQRKINTDNRMITINKRQVSYEGLVSKFENGQNGVYNLIIENDKNIIFTPKIKITDQDVKTIPGLRQLRQAIMIVEEEQKSARGRRKYLLKKQLIEMRQDQYVMKNSYRQPIYCLSVVKNFNVMNFDEKIFITKDGKVKSDGLISFFNPKHVSALLCNYSKLKEDCYGKFYTDGYYMIEVLDGLVDRALKERFPLYYSLLTYKIDGKRNVEIQELLKRQHGITHSIEYISALWRNKIPKLIADRAQEEYLIWYYTNQERGKWKKCTRCGEVKLAHNRFYSKNSSSKDGFYSICKCCRNSKRQKVNTSGKIIKRIPFVKEE